MRQPTMFIDAGDGYANVTGHDGDTAGLAGFTIDWAPTSWTNSPTPTCSTSSSWTAPANWQATPHASPACPC